MRMIETGSATVNGMQVRYMEMDTEPRNESERNEAERNRRDREEYEAATREGRAPVWQPRNF